MIKRIKILNDYESINKIILFSLSFSLRDAKLTTAQIVALVIVQCRSGIDGTIHSRRGR